MSWPCPQCSYIPGPEQIEQQEAALCPRCGVVLQKAAARAAEASAAEMTGAQPGAGAYSPGGEAPFGGGPADEGARSDLEAAAAELASAGGRGAEAGAAKKVVLGLDGAPMPDVPAYKPSEHLAADFPTPGAAPVPKTPWMTQDHAPVVTQELLLFGFPVKLVYGAAALLALLLLALIAGLSLGGGDGSVASAPSSGFVSILSRGRPAPAAELRSKAEGGDADAQFWLASRYSRGIGVEQDVDQAAALFRSAAVQGLAEAQTAYGVALSNGAGVARSHAEAVIWFRKAADQGFAGAQYQLGSACHHGNGLPFSTAAAIRWYQLAAAQNNPEAMYALGRLYESGVGVEKNAVEAVRLMEAAAAAGHASAQLDLASKFVLGAGVERDPVEGWRWATIAALKEPERARQFRRKARDKVSDDEIAAAEEAASKWFTKHPDPDPFALELYGDGKRLNVQRYSYTIEKDDE